MRNLIRRLRKSSVLSLALSCTAFVVWSPLDAAPIPHQKNPMAGMWGIWDLETDMDPNDPLYVGNWLRGSMISVDWSEIKPTKNGPYNWTPLDNKLAAGMDNLEQAILIVYHGNKSPGWVYNGNCTKSQNHLDDGCVPVVAHKPNNPNHRYPDYVDPDYEDYLKPMISAVANHILSNPDYVNLISIIQCPIGKSGDPNPYDANLTYVNGYPSNYLPLGSNTWKNWEINLSNYYFDEYDGSGIQMLFKPADPDMFYTTLPFSANKDQIMMKTIYVSHGYQLSKETNTLGHIRDLAQDYMIRGECAEPLKHLLGAPNGFNFDSSDDGNNTYRYWNDNPRQNLYWQCLWMLHLGMDVFNMRNIERFEQGKITYWQEAREIFQFFNDRAGIKNAVKNSPNRLASDKPWKSKYAFIALREGLAYEDTKYVPGPVPSIGTNNAKNRFLAIRDAVNAQLGSDGHVVMGDVNSANSNKTPLVYLKTLKAQNDVNWKIYKGNFTMFMTQQSVDSTSRGYWNMGQPESLNGGQRFGKYARGFKPGKNNMYFNLDDKFISSSANTNPSSGYVIDINVTYLDRGNAQFRLKYDGDNGQTTAYTHTMGNTNTWKTRTVTITDARFQNSAGSNSDIIIQRVNGSDNPIFHMIEVVKVDDGTGGNPVIDPISNLAVNEGDSQSINVTANAPGGNGGLSLTASGHPGWASFTDNGNGNGSFAFSPGYWVVAHPDSQKTWNATVTVDDGNGGVDSESFVLTVDDINRAPVFTSPNDDIVVDEGASATIHLSANDADAEDSIIFSATGLPAFGTLTDNGDDTATISLSPGYDDAGSYNLSIDISDGEGGSASDLLQITVNDISVGGGDTTFEIEDALFIASSGDPNVGMTSANASGPGSPNYMHYKATAVGDYIQYEVDIPGAGDYEFYVGVQHGKNCGIVELKVNANGIIGTQDFYQNNWSFGEHLIGTKSFTSGGKRTFTFTVTGKNATSNGYKMRLDYLRISQL